jgi:hypothetical protein
MQPKEVKRFLSLAFPCLRRPGEERIFFSRRAPYGLELEAMKEGLNSGRIDEMMLARFFPRAYEGVVRYGLDFYFHEHNRTRERLRELGVDGPEADELSEWCKVKRCTVLGKRRDGYRVMHGKEAFTVSDEVYPNVKAVPRLRKGDTILTHRGCACLRV